MLTLTSLEKLSSCQQRAGSSASIVLLIFYLMIVFPRMQQEPEQDIKIVQALSPQWEYIYSTHSNPVNIASLSFYPFNDILRIYLVPNLGKWLKGLN